MTVQHNPDDLHVSAPGSGGILLALARHEHYGKCCATMLELAVSGEFATVDDDPTEARGRARAALGRMRRAGQIATEPCCEALGPRGTRLRVVIA